MGTRTETNSAPRLVPWLALTAGALLTLATGWMLARHGLALLGDLSPASRVDDAVVLAITLAGALLAAWYGSHLALGSVCLLGAAVGRRWHAGERLVAARAPALVRRAVAAGLGLSIGLSGLAASADVPELPDLGWASSSGARTHVALVGTTTPEDQLDLGWTPTSPDTTPVSNPDPAPSTPDETAPDHTDAAPDPAPHDTTPPPDEKPAQHVVAPGESLWSITSSLLPDADDADVAAAWPRLFDANRDVVGPDPDLIHPGQTLTVPTHLKELP